MALVSGFLRQKCDWTPRGTEYDAYGQPIAADTVAIKCRWEFKSGWVRGVMGMVDASQSYQNKVFVDRPVSSGDTLAFTGSDGNTVSGQVLAVETVVGIDGHEEARICYV